MTAHLQVAVHAQPGEPIDSKACVVRTGGRNVAAVTLDPAGVSVTIYADPVQLEQTLTIALNRVREANDSMHRRQTLAAFSAHHWDCFTALGDLACHSGCEAIADQLAADAEKANAMVEQARGEIREVLGQIEVRS